MRPSVVRDVRDVRVTVEGREMVLAHRVERDVAHHHHLVVLRFERDDEVARRILVQAAADLGVHLGDTLGVRPKQAVAVGILADREQDLADRDLDALDIDRRRRRARLGAGSRRSQASRIPARRRRTRR